jgi:hypothetical protein
MSIKAEFFQGETALTVHGLHQWDYGQTLEIAHPDLPAILEVHFAAVGAQEAAVRVAAGVAGVAEVPIPDELLEQSRPVLAWVYFIEETSGTTALTVTLPIMTRARPKAAGPVPQEIADKYTEAVAAVNDQVNALKEGNVTVSHAVHANTATSAGHADWANTATSADWANTATSAGWAGTVRPELVFSNDAGGAVEAPIDKRGVYCIVSQGPLNFETHFIVVDDLTAVTDGSAAVSGLDGGTSYARYIPNNGQPCLVVLGAGGVNYYIQRVYRLASFGE